MTLRKLPQNLRLKPELSRGLLQRACLMAAQHDLEKFMRVIPTDLPDFVEDGSALLERYPELFFDPRIGQFLDAPEPPEPQLTLQAEPSNVPVLESPCLRISF